MNRIICDICGTTYPDTARQCPICGFANEMADIGAEGAAADTAGQGAPGKRSRGGRFSQANVRKRIRQEDPMPEPEEDGYTDYYEEEAGPESNPFLVSFLVVVIVILLTVTGFLFFRYLLPNLSQGEAEPTHQSQPEDPTDGSTEVSSEPTVPCTGLAITDGIRSVTLVQPGDKHLLNVMAIPEDTTDEMVYFSADEAVATVNAEGRVTAVGSGQTVITVTCGQQNMTCVVICDFSAPTQDPTAAG